MTGVMVGGAVGLIVGLVIELKTGQWKAVISQASGVAGIMAGLLFESVRFWWRKWKRRERENVKGPDGRKK